MSADETIEKEMEEVMRPLVGAFAAQMLQSQKARLGAHGELGEKEYAAIVEGVRGLTADMAGEGMATLIYSGLMKIIDKHFGAKAEGVR